MSIVTINEDENTGTLRSRYYRLVIFVHPNGSIFDPHALDDMIKDGHETKITENPLNDNFYKKEFQRLWNLINHQYAYTVEFDSQELIAKSITHIDEKMFVARLQYTVTSDQQEQDWSVDHLKSGTAFLAEKSQTFTLDRAEGSMITYDLISKIAEGAKLTRRTVQQSWKVSVPRRLPCSRTIRKSSL